MTNAWFRVNWRRQRHTDEYVRSGANPRLASPGARRSTAGLAFLLLVLGARALVFAEPWTNIGPYSGYINSLAIDPRDHNVLYCGTDGANVFKTTNGGVSWRPAREGLQSTLDVVRCLAINPLSPDEIYAGIQLYFDPQPSVRKSTDGGLHWKPASPRIPPGSWVMALACDPTHDGTVYVGASGERGLYVSHDGGDTWTTPLSDGRWLAVLDIAVDRGSPGLVFAAAEDDGIYRSTDWGRNWEPANDGLGDGGRAISVEISPVDANTIYAINTDPRTGSHRLYVSTDTGGSWTQLNGLDYSVNVLKVWTQAAGNPSPGRPMLVATTGNGVVQISYDEAETWVTSYGLEGIGRPNSSNYVLDLASPRGMPWIMYAGTEWGLYKTVDGGKEWRKSHYGITNVDISQAGFVIDPERAGWLATPAGRAAELGGQRNIMVTPDGGVTWWQSMAGIADQYYGDFVSTLRADLPGSPIYAAMNDGSPGVYRSDDDARSWTQVFRLRTGQSYIRFFQMDPVSPETLYLGVQLVEHGIDVTVIYRSTDGGQSWARLSTIKETVFSMAIARTNPSVLYAGPYGPRVYKSVDGGESWRVLSTTGLPDSWFQVGDILVDPALSSVVYANTYPKGLFRSTDAGQTWKSVGTGLVYSVSIVALAIDPTDSRVVYAGVDQNPYLYKSEDRGITWRPIGKGLQGSYVGSIVINPRDPRNIYVGTSGSGIFVTTTGGE